MFGRLLGQLSVLVPCCPATIFALFYVQMNDWLIDWLTCNSWDMLAYRHTNTHISILRLPGAEEQPTPSRARHVPRWIHPPLVLSFTSCHALLWCPTRHDRDDTQRLFARHTYTITPRQEALRSQTDRATWRLSRILANCCITLRAVFVEGVGGLNPPPRENFWPPCCY